MFGNIFSAHIEFVSWREIVQRRVPFRSWIWFMRQHKLAARSGHGQWLHPGIELCVVDDLENTADTKVVIANSSRVSGIALEFVRRGLQRDETITHRNEWLGSLFVHCSRKILLGSRQWLGARRPDELRLFVPDLCISACGATGEDQHSARGPLQAHAYQLVLAGCAMEPDFPLPSNLIRSNYGRAIDKIFSQKAALISLVIILS